MASNVNFVRKFSLKRKKNLNVKFVKKDLKLMKFNWNPNLKITKKIVLNAKCAMKIPQKDP